MKFTITIALVCAALVSVSDADVNPCAAANNCASDAAGLDGSLESMDAMFKKTSNAADVTIVANEKNFSQMI